MEVTREAGEIPLCAQGPQVYEELVALTGIEPEGWQFSPVQLSLCGCGFSTLGILGCSGTPPRTADVTARSQRSRGRTGACDQRTSDVWDPSPEARCSSIQV